MIKLEHVVLASPEQMEFIIEGMRNPMNSWEKSDTVIPINCRTCAVPKSNDSYETKRATCEMCHTHEGCVGPNDMNLMQRLSNNGPVHRKYMRMIPVYVRITAPLYWWKEFDTYKVGTVANSCSTMHKIQEKEFTLEDFSTEHLHISSIQQIVSTLGMLNDWRDIYLNGGNVDSLNGTCRIYEPKNKDIWWQMIQLLPSSYNQTRNIMLNYEVLANIYEYRRTHKLDEWIEFCGWIESLPYSEIITDPVWDKYYKDMDDKKHVKELENTISELEERVKELTKTNEKIRMEFLKCFDK